MSPVFMLLEQNPRELFPCRYEAGKSETEEPAGRLAKGLACPLRAGLAVHSRDERRMDTFSHSSVQPCYSDIHPFHGGSALDITTTERKFQP